MFGVLKTFIYDLPNRECVIIILAHCIDGKINSN